MTEFGFDGGRSFIGDDELIAVFRELSHRGQQRSQLFICDRTWLAMLRHRILSRSLHTIPGAEVVASFVR